VGELLGTVLGDEEGGEIGGGVVEAGGPVLVDDQSW